jgi:hypothetical protein
LRGGLKPQRQTEAGVYGDGVTTGLGSSGGGRSGGGGGWVWERGEVIWASAPDLELRAQGAPASRPGELTLGPGSRGVIAYLRPGGCMSHALAAAPLPFRVLEARPSSLGSLPFPPCSWIPSH